MEIFSAQGTHSAEKIHEIIRVIPPLLGTVPCVVQYRKGGHCRMLKRKPTPFPTLRFSRVTGSQLTGSRRSHQNASSQKNTLLIIISLIREQHSSSLPHGYYCFNGCLGKSRQIAHFRVKSTQYILPGLTFGCQGHLPAKDRHEDHDRHQPT